MEQMEDFLEDFEEPQYVFVGFWPRFGALMIDAIILWLLGYMLNYILSFNLAYVTMALSIIIPIAYNLVLEYKFGATLGKMLLKMKIVNSAMQQPNMSNILLRNIIYIGLEMISASLAIFNQLQYSGADGVTADLGDLVTTSSIIYLSYSALVILVYAIETHFLINDSKCRALHDRIGKTYVVKNTA